MKETENEISESTEIETTEIEITEITMIETPETEIPETTTETETGTTEITTGTEIMTETEITINKEAMENHANPCKESSLIDTLKTTSEEETRRILMENLITGSLLVTMLMGLLLVAKEDLTLSARILMALMVLNARTRCLSLLP